MRSRNSRTLPLYAGLLSHPVEGTVMKVTTSSSLKARLTTFTLFQNSSKYHECTRALCLTFDVKKGIDSVNTKAIMEALDNQDVLTRYMKVTRLDDAIPTRMFTATFYNSMRNLEWSNMGVNVDCRQPHHLRFADDIVPTTSNTNLAERILTEFNETKMWLHRSSAESEQKMLIRNGWFPDAPFTLNGTIISECTS
ncbi:hypothetical protein RB195_019107 [Necator americanus]|uniref:Reverse transcriptase domain-containing protein n=1 Tax=Necator americanus TaxID=51031 RepID=A0ABR1CFI9_NECAM